MNLTQARIVAVDMAKAHGSAYIYLTVGLVEGGTSYSSDIGVFEEPASYRVLANGYYVRSEATNGYVESEHRR